MMQKTKISLDREQAMLKGIVLNHKSQANTDFKPNPNLLSNAKQNLNHANWIDSKHLKVKQHNGGVTLNLPRNIVKIIKICILKWMLNYCLLTKSIK